MRGGSQGDGLVIHSGRGADTLRGGNGRDLLVGGKGKDLANGKQNIDRCVAETRIACGRR